MNGYKHSQEIRDKISKGKKGKRTSTTTEFKKGHKHSKEILEKIGKTLKGRFLAEKSPTWKGGEYIKSSGGYVMVYAPHHPFNTNGKYIRKHRLVMEKHIGRYLRPTEVVHHIDGNVLNNHISNLMLFPNNSAHAKFHKS